MLPATAPLDMVMPHTAQWVMNWLNWSLVGVMTLIAGLHWRTHKSMIGFLFLLGGALTTCNEPIVDVLGKCWFPAVDAWVLMKAWGFTIPLHMLPTYTWFVGGQALLAYRLYENGISTWGVFALYAAYALVNVVLEVAGLNFDQYTYFGNQPLVFFRFPLWWTFCNALMPMAMGAVVFNLRGILTGFRQILVVPLAWMSAAAVNGAVAAPVWLTLNLDSSTLLKTHIASLVSLGMGLMVCYAVALATAQDSATVASHRASIGGSSLGARAKGLTQ